MTSTVDPTEAVAQDACGRVRVSGERRGLLEQFDASGMSAARFAEWCGVKYPMFVGWLQRRKQAEPRERRGRARRNAAPGPWRAILRVSRESEALIEPFRGVPTHDPRNPR